MTNLPNNSILLIDGLHGIYVPKVFADTVTIGPLDETDDEGLEFIRENDPYTEGYWETWEDVLDNTILHGKDGTRYTLHQDGDLWAVPEGAEWAED